MNTPDNSSPTSVVPGPSDADLENAVSSSLEEISVDPAAVVAPPAAAAAPEAAAPAPQPKPRRNEHYLAITTSEGDGLEEFDISKRVAEDITDGPAENKNVSMTRAYDLEAPKPFKITPGLELPVNTHLFMLAEQGKDANNRLRATITPTMLESTAGAVWNGANMIASSLTAQYGMVQSAMQDRAESNIQQFLEHEGSKHAFFSPKLDPEKTALNDPTSVRIRIRTLMGVGGVISIPLFHSGFWLMLSAPSDSALYELNRRFNEEKVALGRMTQGLIFSNEQVYMNSWLLEFCLEHVYDATVKFADKEELRKLISVLDLPVLFTGLARLIWPNGYRYVRSITTKEGIENSTMVEGKLDLAKLLWVDNPYFNTWQKNHMANRTRATVTAEDLERYKKEFPLSAGRTIQMNENIAIVLTVPNAEDSVNDGDRWVSGLVQMVDETFTTARPTPEKRNEVISRHAAMQEMMRYSSWVQKVVFDGRDHDNREAVEAVLQSLSEDHDMRRKFDEEVRKFIADSTGAVIAIPEYNGKENDVPRWPRLIPLDVVTVFFTLLVQKIAK